MKNQLLYLFAFLLLPLSLCAQEPPAHRVVYLWDVTYSTHGGRMGDTTSKTITKKVAGQDFKVVQYNAKYDIYKELVDALIESINQQNPESEIIVVPFNKEVLTKSVWREMGTASGKARLKEHIENFCDRNQTETNIYAAFAYAKEYLFSPKAKYYSEMYVLTDGGHNMPNPSKNDFHRLLRTWCDFAEPNNVKGYYFLLTDKVYEQDRELKGILEESTCITAISGIPKGGFLPPTNQYTIKGDQLVNLKEQYEQPIYMSVSLNDVNRPIQGTEKVHIYADNNPYFDINEQVTIDGNATISITPQPKYSLLELQQMMPTEEKTIITLHMEQVQQEGSKNELVNHSCVLHFVNKPQKTLTITLKK